jgi:hypothetical protein
MKASVTVSVLAASLLIPACQHGGPVVVHTSHTSAHGAQEFSLSARSPVSREHGIRLVSVARDGTAAIELTDSKRRLSARPGQPFVSEEFGRAGLVLERSSFAEQSAQFCRAFAIPDSR